MKRFLIKTSLTILGLLIVSFFLDGFISKSLQHSTAQLYSPWNDLYADTLNHDMVFVGSSRTFMQYNPTVFDSVLGVNSFNLGISARGLDAQIAKYHAYCRRHGMPKYLILNIDICIFHPSDQTEQEREHIEAHTDREQFFPYFLDRKLINELCNDCNEDFSWTDRFLPLMRYAGYNKVLLQACGCNKMVLAPTIKGFSGLNYKNDWDYYNWGHFRYNKSERYDSSLASLIAECRAMDVMPVFVMAPVYDQYMLQLDNRDEAVSMVRNDAKHYMVPLLDFTDSYISADSAYFCDPVHLNSRGAYEFSLQLAQSLRDSLGFFSQTCKGF